VKICTGFPVADLKQIPPPAQGWTAYFVEVDFCGDQKYTSEIVITPTTLPFAGTHCM